MPEPPPQPEPSEEPSRAAEESQPEAAPEPVRAVSAMQEALERAGVTEQDFGGER